ncbi:unnamed protein product [Nippostrongylus brasiliensis]|uniref:Transposase n=1 Tax=Nippostrongylus brasiliensis TaxID=27835 RepID=A0A0N4YR65_NIPBR|nr:unnamed protein product [Nippostrongylus brasiliensis]
MFWNLKKEQVRALRMTWSRLCEPPRSNCRGIVNLVERVWEKLDNDCVRGYPEGCRAWTILVAALVDRIRAAPRRGSMTPSRPSSRASLDDSSQKLLSPSRKSGFTRSIPEIGSGCVNMASMQAALPDVRPGNPAVA